MTTLTRVSAGRRTGEGLSLANGGPLLVLLYGFPIWWLLGFGQLAFLLAAVPMGLHLWRVRGSLTLPKGFTLWLLFLLFVLLSVLAIPAWAPYGDGDGNILTYGYRLAWYLSATVALLYVGNLSAQWSMSLRIPRAVAFMFVVAVAGGVLAMLVTDWEVHSLLYLVLPRGLTSSSFVDSVVSLELSDTQRILGYEQVRPKAPFPYANSWGAGFSAFLPFFLYVWCRRSSGWRLLAAPVVLGAAAVVVVATLNRALWGALIVVAIYGAVQAVRLYGTRGFTGVYAMLVLAIAVIVTSGLVGTVAERLNAPHSDGRRSELAVKTLESTATGSPIVGFGNTRDVLGNFESIAGGATEQCPACGVPPLGTQGQLWLVIFAQGFIAALCFVAFFVYRMGRHVRSRDPRTVVLLAVPLFFILELPFYDSSGIPLFTTMVAMGLMWRSRAEAGAGRSDAQTDSLRAADLWRTIARGTPLALLLGGALALGVGALALAQPRDYRATADVLVDPVPVNLPVDPSKPRTISVDTEARRALSDDVMAEVARATGDPQPAASADVSARVGTQILRLSYVDRNAAVAEKGAAAFAAAYVAARTEYLEERATATVDRMLSARLLEEQYAGADRSGALARKAWGEALANQEARLSRIVKASAGSAEVVTAPVATPQRRNLSVGIASALALGILVTVVITSLRRRGGRGRDG